MEKSKMKAVVVTAERHVELEEQTKPLPRSNEVLIKIFGCMLCTWEQRVFTRVMPFPLPFVGGHEFSGTIEAVGSNVDPTSFPIGAKCAASMFKICGSCEFCRSGKDDRCIHREEEHEIEGKNGLAEYLTVNAENVYLFPDDVPLERIMFTEPLACVVSAHDKLQIHFGDEVAILGAGIMGILNAKLAKLAGARVTLSDPDSNRRQKAVRLGVCDDTIDPSEEDPVAYARAHTKKGGFDVVINTVAIPSAVSQSIDMCAPGSTFLMYGKVFPNEPIPININKIQDSALKIVGTMSYDRYSFQRASKMLANGTVCPEEMGLLSGFFPKEDAQAAYESALKPDTYRIGIKF